MSIKRWMDKQNVVYTHNGILHSHKKDWSSSTCYNMDEPWKHYAKRNKPDTKGKILYDSYHLYEIYTISKFIEIESRV